MWRSGIALFAILVPGAAIAQSSTQVQGTASIRNPASIHLDYETYAAGVHVAGVEAGLQMGPLAYRMDLGFHTTGMVGLLFRGHQLDRVDGVWRAGQVAPSKFRGEGYWRGTDRLTEIEYANRDPVVRHLTPPNADEREDVPDKIREKTIDTLSALVQLIRAVRETGRCELTVRTFDGRRATEIEAHTVGQETLDSSSRSSFSGKALRCDFSGRMLAGFKLGDAKAAESRPLHGSAWLAPVAAGGPPLPVRMAFETRWFGDATMYLTTVTPASE